MRRIERMHPWLRRVLFASTQNASESCTSDESQSIPSHRFCDALNCPCGHRSGLLNVGKIALRYCVQHPVQHNRKLHNKLILREAGIALPLVLIFFVVMTLIGIAAIRTATMGEKIASNTRNQQLAFQAAEQALRHCEAEIQQSKKTGTKSVFESQSLVPIPSKPYGVNKSPQCRAIDISDGMGLGPAEVSRDESIFVYEFTARGTGGSDKAVVRLQSSLRFKK